MKKLKCDLCEGLIVNGRCMECGMFYQHNRGTYYLNEQRPVDDKNMDTYASKSYEASVKDKYSQEKRQRYENQKQEYKGTITSKERKKTENYQWNRTARTDNRTTSARKTNNKPKSKAGAVATVIFFIIAMAAELIENMDFASTNVIEVAPEPEYTFEENFEYEEPDIYEFVVEEMPVEGEEYEATYTSGNYIVGQHIPKGIYTVMMSAQPQMAIPGSWISVTDDVNFIYESWWFDEADERDGYYIFEDIHMYEGAKIEIMTFGEVILYSTNAQIEELQMPVANSLTEAVVLNGEDVIVAEDIEPGTYDAVLVSGEVEINIISPDGHQCWYNLCIEEDYACPGFNNIVLEEGDIVKMEVYGEEAGCAILNPSPEIFE